MTDVTKEINAGTENQLGQQAGIPTAATSTSSSSTSNDPVTTVTEQLAAVTIHTPQEKYEQAKKAYVESRFNPTDPKEKEQLALRLKTRKEPIKKPASESESKQYDEAVRVVKEIEEKHIAEKREILTKEFEADFDLKLEEDKLLEAYAQANFKPNAKWRTQTQAKYDAQIAQERIDFIDANRKPVVLQALKDAIKQGMSDDDAFEVLEREERVQEYIAKPVNKTYEEAFAKQKFQQSAKKLSKELIGVAPTPVHFSLKAKQLWSAENLNNNKQALEYTNSKANPANFFSEDKIGTTRTAKANAMMLTRYQETVASAASKIKTEKMVAEGIQKPFTRLGFKSKA